MPPSRKTGTLPADRFESERVDEVFALINSAREVGDDSGRVITVFFALQFLVDLLKGALFPPSSVPLFWVVDVFGHILVPGAILFALSRIYRIGPQSYGLANLPPSPSRLELGPALITYTLFLAAAYFAGYVLGLFLENQFDLLAKRFSYGQMMPIDRVGYIVVAFYFSITAGLFEEIFYRAMFQIACDRLLPSFPRSAVIVSSASFFALIHWPFGLAAVLGSFFFGLVAAWFYSKQRDLRPLVAAHILIGLVIYLKIIA